MADSSWDNGGAPTPAPKAGMPLWGKLLIGCGVLFLLAIGSCVGGIAYLGHKAKKDPEGMKRWAMGFAMDFIKPEWDDLRDVLGHLRTDEGCRALYQAHPGLAKDWATVEAFLKDAREWRDQLPDMPAEPTTEILDKHELSINSQFGGETRVVYRPKGGLRFELLWDRPHRKTDKGPRKLLHLEVS